MMACHIPLLKNTIMGTAKQIVANAGIRRGDTII